jgi:hypothetical protein
VTNNYLASIERPDGCTNSLGNDAASFYDMISTTSGFRYTLQYDAADQITIVQASFSSELLSTT